MVSKKSDVQYGVDLSTLLYTIVYILRIVDLCTLLYYTTKIVYSTYILRAVDLSTLLYTTPIVYILRVSKTYISTVVPNMNLMK
jgi:hypothetical protein